MRAMRQHGASRDSATMVEAARQLDGFTRHFNEINLPSTTSALVQLWTAPQWAQVNFCGFIFVAAQRFCSMVRPVSVSLEVEGQRTNRLFRSAPAFGFGRRCGGSK